MKTSKSAKRKAAVAKAIAARFIRRNYGLPELSAQEIARQAEARAQRRAKYEASKR